MDWFRGAAKPKGRRTERSDATSFSRAALERASWRWLRNTISHNRPRADELAHPVELARGAGLHVVLRHRGYTMLSSQRARTLYRLASEVERRNVGGAIVDCGVWNGGSTLLLSLGAPSREVYALDSFLGLPEPSLDDGPDSVGWAGTYAGSAERVRQGFSTYADSSRLKIRPGWFEKTIPILASEVGPIAILHVDADWYDSVALVLRTLYGLIVPGGFVIIDDYASWVGARKATDDFRIDHNITTPMYDDHYWRV